MAKWFKSPIMFAHNLEYSIVHRDLALHINVLYGLFKKHYVCMYNTSKHKSIYSLCVSKTY